MPGYNGGMDNLEAPRQHRGGGTVLLLILVVALAAGGYLLRDHWMSTVQGMFAGKQSGQGEDTDTVYVLPEGYVYHRQSCPILHGGGEPRTLEAASAGGYKPCTRCNPPK
jgi:hypothetical protein